MGSGRVDLVAEGLHCCSRSDLNLVAEEGTTVGIQHMQMEGVRYSHYEGNGHRKTVVEAGSWMPPTWTRNPGEP